MKKILFLIVCGFVLSTGVMAQSSNEVVGNWCGTSQRMNSMWNNPQTNDILTQDQLLREQEALNPVNVPKGTIYRIPTVFHILHNGGAENISEEQIFNAIEVMTRDFRKQNADTTELPLVFDTIAGDAEIEFVLATKAPDGTCFQGYTRTQSPLTHEGDDGGAQVDAIRNGNDVYQGNWPSDQYLNVFVIADAGGAGGYTNYPSNWNLGDMSNGIWILHTQFGEIGTSSPSGGRSMTHEVGHWLNLPHTWGSNNDPGSGTCDIDIGWGGQDNNDDGVADTPRCLGTSSCSMAHNSCSNDDIDGYWTMDVPDNVQNYMDYALSCQTMFTLGQVDRMRTAITSSVGGRNNLWTPGNLTATGADGDVYLCETRFSADRTSICSGEVVQFTDESFNSVNGWEWTFAGGTPATSTDQHPTVTYNTPGIYEVSLTATDGTTDETETKTGYIRVVPSSSSLPFLEGFESFSTLDDIDEWEVINLNGNGFELEAATGLNSAKSARLLNYGQTVGSMDELVASPVDLSAATDITLSYRYAYKRRNSADEDRMRVFVTNNCGDSWAVRNTLLLNIITADIQTAPFTPASESDWKTVHVTNITSTYFVDNFRFKFAFEAGGGNNMYLDNINIYEGEPSDELVVGITDLEDTELSGLTLYPNPTDSELNVEFTVESTQDIVLSMQDLTGKIVQQHLIKAETGANHVFIETSGMAAGVYFLEIYVGGSKETRQVIVK